MIIPSFALALFPGQAQSAEVEFGFPERIAGWGFNALDVEAVDIDGDGDLDIATGATRLPWFENIGGFPTPLFRPHDSSRHGRPTPFLHRVDLDGDGDLDLLGTDRFRFEIRWHENLGGSPPSYSDPRVIAVVPGMLSEFLVNPFIPMAPADIDNDGDVDVVTQSDDVLQWHENDGASPPSFTTHEIDGRVKNTLMLVADLDGDGDDDVITQKMPMGLVWFENGGGSAPVFELRDFHEEIVEIDLVRANIAVSDIDGDNDLDVFVSQSGAISWFENRGGSPAEFVQRLAGGGDGVIRLIEEIAMADLDGDGDVDIVSGQSHPEEAILWQENLGGPEPMFSEPKTVVMLPHPDVNDVARIAIYVVDLDADGDLDILSASSSEADGTVAWHENDGADEPSFTSHMIANAVFDARSVFAIDMDADGDTDVLSASGDDGRITWYENQGGPSPWFAPRLISATTASSAVMAVDIEGDGDVDVFTGAAGLPWFESDGGNPPRFNEHKLNEVATAVWELKAVDLDADDDLDIVSGGAGEFPLVWFENDGSEPPIFLSRPIPFAASVARSISLGDLDGDGNLDIFVGSLSGIFWFESNGAAIPEFIEHIVTEESAAESVSLADFDGDGDLDAVTSTRSGDVIKWFENDGGSEPAFSVHIITEALSGPRSVFVADIDRDGDIDVVSASYISQIGNVAWHENNGARPPSFTTHIITNATPSAQAVFSTDLDSDGDFDVLLVSEFDARVQWFENMLLSPFNASKTQWKLYP